VLHVGPALVALLATALLWGVWLGFAAGPAFAHGGHPDPEGPSGYYVTFVARWCPEYTDIYANHARNDIVESLENLGEDTQYDDTGELINPAKEDQGTQELVPTGVCHTIPEQFGLPVGQPGWVFTLGRGYVSRAVTGAWGSLSKVTDPFSPQAYRTTEITTQYATVLRQPNGRPDSRGGLLFGAVTVELTNEERDQASSPDQLWAQGGTPADPVLASVFGTTDDPTYGFGTLRCATDNLNGDNVEYIFFPEGVKHVFCYAYYVKPAPPPGLITIAKKVTDAPSAVTPAFQFTGNLSFDPNGFQLSNGGSTTFYRAGGTSWSVTEQPVADYTLDSISCVDAAGAPASNVDVNGPEVTIHLGAGDHITCTYTNRYTPPPGSLAISKVTRGGIGTFPFTVSGGGHVYHASATTTYENVPAAATPDLGMLAPNTYTISESIPSVPGGRWRLVNVICDGTTFSTQPVTVTVTSGAQVSCQFTNVFIPRGSISLAKITEGATGTVAFLVEPVSGNAQYLQTATTTSQGVAANAVPNTPADATDRLRLGSYRIVEQGPPSTPSGGWTLMSVTCAGVLLPFSQGATVVTLTSAQPSVRCVYTDSFTATPEVEPGPEPPEPLPPESGVTPGPSPDEPGLTWTDLAVKKTASPPVAVVGDLVTYHITVTNHGPNDATRVVLADKPGGAADVVSARTDVGTCRTGVPIICLLGTLKSGEEVHVTVQLRPDAQTDAFTNRAVVGTSTYDPTLANNVAHATVRVLAPPPAVGLG
jgi:uncharacterized repeat protein (TIGR01451 family)